MGSQGAAESSLITANISGLRQWNGTCGSFSAEDALRSHNVKVVSCIAVETGEGKPGSDRHQFISEPPILHYYRSTAWVK